LQLDLVVVLRCDHDATVVVRMASARMSTMDLERIMTWKSAVLLTGLVAVAYSLPSVGLTSKYLPVCTDLIATTSPSFGWKRSVDVVSSATERAAKASRAVHATAHAMKIGVERPI